MSASRQNLCDQTKRDNHGVGSLGRRHARLCPGVVVIGRSPEGEASLRNHSLVHQLVDGGPGASAPAPLLPSRTQGREPAEADLAGCMQSIAFSGTPNLGVGRRDPLPSGAALWKNLSLSTSFLVLVPTGRHVCALSALLQGPRTHQKNEEEEGREGRRAFRVASHVSL